MSDSEAKQNLKALFEEHGEGLRRFAWYRTGNEESANDIVQEAFIKLWEKQDTVDWPRASGLLYTMVGNLAANYHKHRKVRMEFESLSTAGVDHQDPSFQMEHEEFRAKLEDCIGSLVPTARTAFLMSRIESLKYREIAERLEISIKAVEKRMGIAIRLLTQCVGQKI